MPPAFVVAQVEVNLFEFHETFDVRKLDSLGYRAALFA